jgi:hypothetical protein
MLEKFVRRREASRSDNLKPALTVGGKGKTGADICLGQVREISQNLFLRHTRRNVVQDIIDSDACAAEASLATAPAWINCDNHESPEKDE